MQKILGKKNNNGREKKDLDNAGNNIMVSVRCTAYNQEHYIRQCLEGFVMQKTNFRFEAIVHDDASTDNTAAIIREYAEKYPDIIKPVYETENQYSKHDGSLRRILDSYMHGKYVAYCEGDDYWTDPLKLQKQVDFLESHPDYSMSYTNTLYYDQNNDFYYHGKQEAIRSKLQSNISCEDIIKYPAIIMTLTVVMRKDVLFQINDSDPFIFESGNFLLGDIPNWYTASRLGKVHYLDEITSVYRVLDNSASHIKGKKNRYKFSVSAQGLRAYLCRRDNLSLELSILIEKRYANVLFRHLALNPEYVPIVPLLPKKHKFKLFLLKYKLLKPYYTIMDFSKRTIKFFIKPLLS